MYSSNYFFSKRKLCHETEDTRDGEQQYAFWSCGSKRCTDSMSRFARTLERSYILRMLFTNENGETVLIINDNEHF